MLGQLSGRPLHQFHLHPAARLSAARRQPAICPARRSRCRAWQTNVTAHLCLRAAPDRRCLGRRPDASRRIITGRAAIWRTWRLQSLPADLGLWLLNLQLELAGHRHSSGADLAVFMNNVDQPAGLHAGIYRRAELRAQRHLRRAPAHRACCNACRWRRAWRASQLSIPASEGCDLESARRHRPSTRVMSNTRVWLRRNVLAGAFAGHSPGRTGSPIPSCRLPSSATAPRPSRGSARRRERSRARPLVWSNTLPLISAALVVDRHHVVGYCGALPVPGFDARGISARPRS